HQSLCSERVSAGSIRTGYARSAARHPTLLATDRKYGSAAPRARVPAYHRCNSGLVVDTAKNGSPTEISSVTSSHAAGAPAGGSVRVTAIGSAIGTTANNTRWTIGCRRTPK